MAGSQLKQLKAALKSSGLIGQTNQKKKNQRSKTPSETRRQDREKVVNGIRDQFNSFDQRFDRTKHDVSVISGGKFVKVGSKQHNDATRAKSTVQKTMRMQYDLEKNQHNKTGGIQDRRFGENNSHLSSEEKMLERFTRERQGGKKKNAFALGESDEEGNEDDDGGFTLTHGGKAIAEESEMGGSAKRYIDEENQEEEGVPARKKSKKEVMEEIIAKSKFHKQQRQKEFKKAQDEIMDLDDEFGDVMDEMRYVKQPEAPKFSTKTPESVEYDSKVRELTYDRRSAPASRTKTDEELMKEHSEKMKKLEADRMRRMNGLEVDDRGAEGDDLDGDFWAGSENEEEGFSIREDEPIESEEEESESESLDDSRRPHSIRVPVVSMPETHEQFVSAIEAIEEDRQAAYIAKIIEVYKPNLAAGNKEKMNKFVGILLEHVLYVSNDTKVNQALVEKFIKIVKKLAETYNETLVADIRVEIAAIQRRILATEGILLKRDLVLFVLIGYLFSTSDHFHLIVTPTLILMNETLSKFEHTKVVSLERLAQGVFISDILLNYQRLSKRYIPEMINFVEKSMLSLIPEPTKFEHSRILLSTDAAINTSANLQKKDKFEVQPALTMNDLVKPKETPQFKFKLLVKLFSIIDRVITLYRDKSVMPEIVAPLIAILKHLVRYGGVDMAQLISPLVTKLSNIQSNVIRAPLALQQHKSVAIKTYAPKFEENFNPDKFSYDVNRERAELNKVQNELKKEKKSALRDVRQESRFVATRKIEEKKVMYDAYHKKMANIVNTISTVEGAEKNQYEREKKMRKNK